MISSEIQHNFETVVEEIQAKQINRLFLPLVALRSIATICKWKNQQLPDL